MIQRRRRGSFLSRVTPGKGDKKQLVPPEHRRSKVGTLEQGLAFCVPIIRAEAHIPCVTVTDAEPVPPVADPFGPDFAPCYLPYTSGTGTCCRESLVECPERAGPCVARALSCGPSLCTGHILSPLLCMHSVSRPLSKTCFCLYYFSALICFLREEGNFPFHMCLTRTMVHKSHQIRDTSFK